ncbi:MAG TPA: isoamylase early set domain-containing protein [Anaerolineae bacterium]|nr:isoamylase early set domain-containing protein [Anaerolineae bacterium]
MIQKEPARKKGLVRVTFVLPSNMWAERVNLVGDFNDWDTTATPMSRHRSDSNWRASLELPAGETFKFRYLIDGKEWLNDWHADDHVENPYGSFDSVVDLNEFAQAASPPAVDVAPSEPEVESTMTGGTD